MDIQVQNSTIIPQANPNAEPVKLPLTVFDRYAPHYHVGALIAFNPPTPSNSAMIEGLAKTLVHYPTLTARLGSVGGGNRPCLLVGGKGGGALIVEATVASRLEQHLPLEPRPGSELLHPPWLDVEGPVTTLQIQLNRFDCGGLIIGLTADHRVGDGQSMSNFFIAWASAVRGANNINPLPVYDQSWLKPRSPPRCSFEHWGLEFKPISPNHKYVFPLCYTSTDPHRISNVLLNYSSNFITKLKSNVKQKFSTFEILLAHVWRKVTMARGLHNDESSTVSRVCINGRSRLKPPVPNEFFGNLVLSAYPNASAKGLIQGDLTAVASTIHKAVVDIDDEYFQSVIDFGAINEDEELVSLVDNNGKNVMLPDLDVSSMLGFRFQELNFGGGGDICAFTYSWVPLDGLVAFLPSLEDDGGINVFVGLLEEHAKILKKISHSLD